MFKKGAKEFVRLVVSLKEPASKEEKLAELLTLKLENFFYCGMIIGILITLVISIATS